MGNLLYTVQADKIAAEVIDGEVIIINVETGTYYNTEGIGGWAWERCVEGKSVDAMADLGHYRYDVSTETIALELRQFFASLQEEDLVAASNANPAEPRMGEILTNDRLPYSTPKLVTYRDLKDLLALDPPMPRLGGPAAAGNASRSR